MRFIVTSSVGKVRDILSVELFWDWLIVRLVVKGEEPQVLLRLMEDEVTELVM